MSQSRNRTGVEFEKMICEANGWSHKSVSPRIRWSGNGKSNWAKIKDIELDPTKFIPNFETSRLVKYDAINENGDKIEIKKYTSSTLKSWISYSEPIFKVGSWKTLGIVTKLFGDGDYEKSVVEYNNFVKGVICNVGFNIIESITKSCIGVQCIDRFVPQDELEFKWVVKDGWKDYNRLSIVFRLKQK